MPSRVRTVLILLLTLGLLWFFFRNADMPRVWAEMRHARAPLLLAAVLVTGLTYVLRALRWQYLLAPIGHTHFSNAFRATVIGFAATFLLPARAGEIIRPYLLARREGLPGTAAFATIILERLLDLVTVLLLFAFFVLTADPASTSAAPAAMERVKVGGLHRRGGRRRRAGRRLRCGRPSRAPGPLGAQHRAGAARPDSPGSSPRSSKRSPQGLAVMRQPRRLLVSFALSIPLWMSIAAGIWLTSLAFHITFPFVGSFLVMTILVVGVAMPTPGRGRRIPRGVPDCRPVLLRRRRTTAPSARPSCSMACRSSR